METFMHDNTLPLDGKSSVAALIARYLDGATVRLKEETIRRGLRPALATLVAFMGPLPICDVTPERADAYQTQLFRSYKHNTACQRLAVAKGVFTYAVKLGIVHLSPFRFVRLPKPQRVGRNVEDATLRELLPLLAPKYRRAVLLSLYTGMRRSEVTYLDWDREIFADHIRIPPERSKSGRERFIPTGAAVRAILGPRRHGRVFDFSPDTLTHAMTRAWRKLGVERIRFHDMRHTAVTKFFEVCDDRATALAVFGWTNDRSAAPYQHITQRRRARFLKIRYRLTKAANGRPRAALFRHGGQRAPASRLANCASVARPCATRNAPS